MRLGSQREPPKERAELGALLAGWPALLELFAKHGRFDLVLMDYRMPEMNGIEAAKIIQTHRKEAKIILVTAQGSVKQQALDAGLSFIEKPFSMKQLARTL